MIIENHTKESVENFQAIRIPKALKTFSNKNTWVSYQESIRKPGKEQESKPKGNTRKAVTNIKAEISELSHRKIVDLINKSKF